MKWAFDVSSQHGLSQSHRLVLLALAFHHHQATDDCFPTLATVADYAGLSERRARSAAHALDAMGLIRIKKRSERGVQRSNQFDLFGRFRADVRVTPKTGFRADGGGHPQTAKLGGTHASADRVSIYTGETDDAKILSFATAKELKFAGGAK